jgi:hypothetical protein
MAEAGAGNEKHALRDYTSERPRVAILLRGYSTRDGCVERDCNTVPELTRVDRAPARGRSVDVGDPVIANGGAATTSGDPQ